MIRGNFAGTRGDTTPMYMGQRPRRLRAIVLRVVAAALMTGLAASFGAGCANTDDNQVNKPNEVGMTDQMAPYYSDQETTLYQAQIPVKLPIRQPTDQERKNLGDLKPYPHAPYLTANDERVEIRFTLSNVDDKEHKVELLLDAWNEFDRYKPGIQVVSDEETTPDFSVYDRYFILGPKARVQGTITSDDTHEMEVDLATAEYIQAGDPPLGPDDSGNALMNHAMNLQNRSTQPDPFLQKWIPTGVVPGMTGFDLGIRTTEPANVAVEVTVDITDLNGNRLVPQGQAEPTIGMPPNELQPPKGTAM